MGLYEYIETQVVPQTMLKKLYFQFIILIDDIFLFDLYCGLVARVLGYRSGGPGSIPGTTRKRVVGLFSLVSTTEELLDRKVAAPV
jgi:hypothetical protein